MQTQTPVQTIICRLSPGQCRSLLHSKGLLSIMCCNPTELRDMVRQGFATKDISPADIREVYCQQAKD